MTQTLALQSRRIVTPVVALIVVLAAVAALALGFGLRVWTEKSSSTPAPHIVVLSGTGSSQLPHCKIGHPC